MISIFWKSQSDYKRFPVDNLMSAAVVLFCANTYHTIASFFQSANIQWISKTSSYEIQKKNLVGTVNRNYVQHSKGILITMKGRGNCCLIGDSRCDSRGHNAKYLTHSFMDKETDKIAAMSLIQVFGVDNLNQMEKKGFIKTLQMSKDENITPTHITTNHHTQIHKYMREKEPGINIHLTRVISSKT